MRFVSPSTALLLVSSLSVAAVSLAACDQPKWREKPAEPPDAATAPATGPAPVRQIPSDPAGVPAAPEWAAAVMGKTVRDAYPKTGLCKGNTDIVQKTYAGQPAGVQIHGWGWDTAKKARVERIVLVDKTFKIVGAGKGGVKRPDVTTAVPEITDPNSGWNADAPVTAGPLDAYGVLDDGSICVLGHIEF